MNASELITKHIEVYFTPAKDFVEIEYLKRVNKIMSDHLLEKAKLFKEGKIFQAFSLDKILEENLSNEKTEKEKAIEYYYFKAVKNIFELVRKIDFEYTYQMEVQKAFSFNSPLSMYKCKMGAVVYK